jgi:succinyl-diaminopimelate desuccinylase
VDAGTLLGITEELCAVPSVSGNEALLADLVEQRLRAEAPELRVDRLGNNVVARTEHGHDKRVVLGGHLDTVPSNGNAAPEREGDTLHGLGTADMKGGLAILLALAAAAGHATDHGSVRFDTTYVFYEAEEIADEFNGLRKLFAERPAWLAGDLALLLEPTAGWLEAGCQGTVHVRATFRGERAHSARPWKGRNAIHRAAPVLEHLARQETAVMEVEGVPYRESVQVVRIEGGVANNVVPDVCSIVVNRRFAPIYSTEEAIAQVEALLEGADELEILNASNAAPPNLRDPLIAELVGTFDLGVRAKLGWTDVARFAAAGMPAANFGPGDPELAHTADEEVTGEALDGCYAVLGRFLGLA